MTISVQKRRLLLLFICVLLQAGSVFARDESTGSIQLKWTDNREHSRPHFQHAAYLSGEPNLPVWQKYYPGTSAIAVLGKTIYEPVNLTEYQKSIVASQKHSITTESVLERKAPGVIVTVYPFRISNGQAERLVSFEVSFSGAAPSVQRTQRSSAASFSVLAGGDWYKIGVINDGIYRLTYSDLLNLGMDPSALTLQSIRLFGNGGGMVPLLNSTPRPDDLLENAIRVVDADQSGQFNNGDYILFYGQSQNRWSYNTIEKRYLHQRNYFSDTTYYFITADLSTPGKRIPASPSETPGGFVTVNSFIDYAFQENDLKNFIKSGRNWYGEAFDIDLNQQFTFGFPNLVPGPATFKSSVISRTSINAFVTSDFVIRHNGTVVLTQSVPSVGTSYTEDFARGVVSGATINASGNEITLDYTYLPYNTTSTGWLDYIAVNARRSLLMNGNSMLFREQDTTASLMQRKFQLSSNIPALEIWDITSQADVKNQEYIQNGGTLEFYRTISGSASLEFIAFNQQSIRQPILLRKVANQNLHALPQCDFIIVAHPDFLQQAERLADFHRSTDSLRTVVASTEQVYNEFSSGAQDVAAIRDFVKMFYDRAVLPSDLPRYVLLFGDGSYDHKNRTAGNTNFVPTFQSENSISLIGSYTCDDFFGMMDPNEGTLAGSELIDLGIGRLPVKNAEEARAMVDKIITYSTPGVASATDVCGNGSSRLGDWRNILCFVADDQDRNLHFRQSERIVNVVTQDHPEYNIDKIMCDAYQQVTAPGGQRYPDVNNAIDKRIEKGAFLINYTGHGGELGWAAEGILNNDMIRAWDNANALPAFITATCEFSRYDDPSRTSAGEYVLLNSKGGGICLFTTIRLAFAIDNELINTDMLEYFFKPVNGIMPRTGDIMRLSKRDNPSNRNVTLLGDPALQLSYPEYKVETTAILDASTGQPEDTLRALAKVTVQGKVVDGSGNTLSGFNGLVYPVIYDKSATIRTLVNDATGIDISLPDSFKLRRNILYRGKASVTNGTFTCDFIIPKDIAYQFGSGRLSYYAHNNETDAKGYDESFFIGGTSPNALNDQAGPQITLYMNNEQFVFGGMTDDTPDIYAVLSDSSGINTVGNGIGHDITAQLDGEPQKLYVLNDYYEADLNSYQSGKVLYTLGRLSEGRHSLVFKAWDINNNSSEKTTEFIVASSEKMALAHVLNYPNPFTTHTSFFFEHNRPCEGINIQVQVYTVSGKLVKTLEGFSLCNGTRETGITWDGRDDFGDPLAKGVYVYRLRVRSPDGDSAEKLEKLVLLR